MTQTNPIIELRDVSFSYGKGARAALDHVSLSISEGDFVGVIGPSGAGKSTLAAVMSGAIPHHFTGQLYGATLIDGKDTCEVTLTDISRIVGSVLQDIDAQMVASVVEDEMLFGLENFGVPHDQIDERISQTLATVGISDLREREIVTLSGGQKQKVAIAAILALAPRVLVLDEPTAALDPASITVNWAAMPVTATGTLALYEPDFGADGTLSLGSKVGDSVITALAEDTELDMTAVVYLSGDAVDSTVFSATQGLSLNGGVNLQFASSTALTPMDYDFTAAETKRKDG